MSSRRPERVESLIGEIVGSLLVSGKLKDHRISPFATVTYVKVSSDFAYAKIGISCFDGAAKAKTSVVGLNSAKGIIQRELAQKMRLRNTPVLTFFADSSLGEGYLINKKIEELLIESPVSDK